ncbi:MAG: hypothetical protein H6552_00295 [Chitinophagales bacterium]|nr:hypothetical protein [Chitinophagales bacterium]
MDVLERKLLKTVELAKVIGCSRSWIIKCRTNKPELKKYTFWALKTTYPRKVEENSTATLIAGE